MLFDRPTVKVLIFERTSLLESKRQLPLMLAQRECPRNADSSPKAVVVCLARTQGRSCCTMTVTQSAGIFISIHQGDLPLVHLVHPSLPKLLIHAPNNVNISTLFSPCERICQRKSSLIQKVFEERAIH